MDQVSPVLQARFEALLGLFEDALEGDYATKVVGPQEGLPVPTLLVSFGADDKERDRTLGITVVPFDEDSLEATDLVQFYVRMPFEVPAQRRTEVMAATAAVNAAMAIGHFAVRGTELYYRYVLALPNDTVADASMLLELVALVSFHQETFADHLEGILEGEITLSLLPDILERTTR